ncbi:MULTISPECIES: DUF501 domain-containing protein [unclassified Kosmotoga]|jgi:hypothetical protein|uniref:DUF501 domain-containing protein n=1 Tax=unclassified Kosmotoga TaxID=2631489 RepID=UPI0007C49456|nr:MULTISPECIES: DUF501 domain-containing protein [unclassified Kosmotoga]MDI3524017.1 uncharacterized protein [Kosmotoga sp.]OAA23760.1 hypothetical protein DU53_01595 [Kosmotoga sp. DU53]
MGGFSNEKEIIKLQLGRDIENDFIVVRRCSWGYPQCIKSSLITNGKPFPTLFWLTCPLLLKEISKLEEKGMIKTIESRLENDENFMKAYVKAHKETKDLKEQLLASLSISEWQRNAIIERGIGGIKDLKRVKCLHLQLANYMGGIKNPIGELIWKIIELQECPPNDIICDRLVNKFEK